ncbi:GNAT family N-acetyltransferase [Acerihabitans sp. KWT182]|uniref:GNAT family N-acetyltransferase n=1 Tax=Acerihabitans sp. KWT182 TaxID=3157919 RepID=A0AAU7Q9N9_9GAMM
MKITYTDKTITAVEYNELRNSVGWSVPSRAQSELALEHSLYINSAYLDQRIIGSGRLVGDGSLSFCIMDVMVHPDFQNSHGIGKQILRNILRYLKVSADPQADIYCMATSGHERFYETMGFVARPNEKIGCRYGHVLR